MLDRLECLQVLGYVVRYYDTEPRWPVKNEKEDRA